MLLPRPRGTSPNFFSRYRQSGLLCHTTHAWVNKTGRRALVFSLFPPADAMTNKTITQGTPLSPLFHLQAPFFLYSCPCPLSRRKCSRRFPLSHCRPIDIGEAERVVNSRRHPVSCDFPAAGGFLVDPDQQSHGWLRSLWTFKPLQIRLASPRSGRYRERG